MKVRHFAIFLVSLLLGNPVFAQQTEIKFLSGTDAANTVDWEFFCTDGRNSGEWTKIAVPSNWELQGFGTYNYGHDWKNEKIKLGKEHGLYKTNFDVPSTWKGKTVNIVFDGSMTDTKVKINGRLAGEIHQGAFYRFKYDISKLLKYGQSNLLEVDVAKHSSNESVNKAERQADFWIFGGIFRPVFLEVLPETHFTRTAIDAKADGTLNTLLVLNQSKKDYSVGIELFDLEGNKMEGSVHSSIKKGTKESFISGKFEGIKAWNPEWPTLYNLKITLKNQNEILHQVTRRIGFRTVELRPHDGIYVNNEKVVFKGVNRHSFWPETGRCLSEENILNDILLIKEMNMNAVRCSHYVPDKRFLELCDSIGLFVLNEVTGWQDGYDTLVGPKVIKETVLKDENHPSVVIWDHGNEGGWLFENEKWLHHWDIQKRPVICPWLLHNGIDTHHYPDYYYATARYKNGNDPFMPTELLHGLYDGGHGAGLEDFWRHYETSPLHAGGFLWVFSDEAILRTDKEGTVYDSDGNHAPDGILGPHREKEGSFYTIKEIWSPVQVKPVIINKKWNGKLFLENKFIYTNLRDCGFSWQAIKTEIGNTNETIVGSGIANNPDAAPGETAMLKIDIGNALKTADIFRLKAIDQNGHELYTWSWPVIQAEEKAKEMEIAEPEEIKIEEQGELIIAAVKGYKFSFSKKEGKIEEVNTREGKVSFSGGPVAAGAESKVTDVKWEKNEEGDYVIDIWFDGYPRHAKWILHTNGLLYFEAQEMVENFSNIDFLGISFYYPEEKVKGIKWMGQGPYRVWKNRLKGSNFGIWQKDYNNTITGESYNNLVYPEFKGYHGKMYWLTLQTLESDFTILTETPNLFFQLYQPGKPKHVAGGTHPPFPDGDLSFLYEIPAIGTKFKQVEAIGPGSRKGNFYTHKGGTHYPLKLWFDFRNK